MDTQRINICDEDASFECTIRFPPVGFSEFKEYVEEFECKLLYLIYEDEDSEGEEKVIGKLHGYRFSLYDCYRDYDEDKEDALLPLDILDMIDDNVARLMCLFEDACYIKPKYFKKWQNILDLDVPEITPNIILINRVEVLAEYRGRRLGESLISNSLYTISRRNETW
ncbi:MAG: hypothetical protein LBE72_02015 [Rickettsia sp.]|jgi:hypothetical protein|nr:hypothetical protein [Rickettsia sp.]